ncbi:prevent-host-death family protein [Opitutaceae bacterium TAV1]|nr:prevent-host-death family protein [Opitutaceae bacterium TAV1]
MAATVLAHDALEKDSQTGLRQVATSTLRNHLGEIVDSVAASRETLLLMSHKRPKAVLVPYDTYLAMASRPRENLALDVLTEHYDQMAMAMNTPAAKAGVEKAFAAGPAEFSQIRIPH